MKKKKENKLNISGLIVLLIMIAITVLGYVFSTHLFDETSVFNNDPTSNTMVNTLYHKIPALLKSVQIVTIAYLIIALLKIIVSKSFIKNKRGQTIAKLINSFVKYLIAIVAILLVLSAFGVDTRTLLASAGILGLVIGLGAQSLIADIIAGVFIVFEGDFEVGDIVVIDDWRGTVYEIGIRTTKIIDYGGNMKIVNNSHISSLINQTKELSMAVSQISIEYDQSIPAVEHVIMENLGRIKENIPEIKEGPYYKGVNSLSASSVDLLFVARCKEEDLYGVQRAMNRELKLIFDENGIKIPFPQITVSEYSPSSQDFASRENKEKIEDFVREQREASKDLEEKS